MELDVVALSRAQFAFTIMFHYLFPPLSIGLGGMLVFFEAIYLRTGDRDYEALTRFFTKIFAVNFALGVASGIVMEFQFGTNWSTYSRFVGDVFGSALAAEGSLAGIGAASACTSSLPVWSGLGRFFPRCGSSLPTVGSRPQQAFTWLVKGQMPGPKSRI